MSGINGVNNYTNLYNSYDTKTAAAKQTAEKTEAAQPGAVYEPSKEGKAAVDRSAIVAQLKADAEARAKQMTDLVHKMMSQQGVAIGKSDDMWRFWQAANLP